MPGLPRGRSSTGHFLSCYPLFQNHFSPCKVGIKLASTHHVLRNSWKTNHSIRDFPCDIKVSTVREVWRSATGSSPMERKLSWEPQLPAVASTVYFCWILWTHNLLMLSLPLAICSFIWNPHPRRHFALPRSQSTIPAGCLPGASPVRFY